MSIQLGRFQSVVQNGTKKRNLAASLVIALIVLPEPLTTVLGVMLACVWWLLKGK